MVENDRYQMNTLDAMLNIVGLGSTLGGVALYLGLESVEKEKYDEIDLMNIAEYGPHYLIAAGIPILMSSFRPKLASLTAFLMAAANIVHETLQHYNVIDGGLQLEDIAAGTLGALTGYAVHKYSRRNENL